MARRRALTHAVVAACGPVDNPPMIRVRRVGRFGIAASLAAVLIGVGACGSLEWPPRGRVPVAVNAPPPPSSASSAPPAQASPQASSPAFAAAGAVTAGPGDTVYALSRRHRVPVRAIIQANKLAPPYHLNEGQRVELPRGPTYLVQRGDTLHAVARDRRVDPYALARLNGLKPPYVIQTGETLVMPERTDTAAELAARPPAPTARAPTLPGTPAISEQPLAPPGQTAPPAAVPDPPAASGSGFIWPVRGQVVSSFGHKARGLRNDGINIAAQRGTPVMASEHGVVAYAGNELRGFGNLLLIKHSNGWITAYAHNDAILVKRGDRVQRGQRIATVGATGNVRSPQLHFELRRGRIAENPEKHLKGA
jgi:murein DD-endopeptidase MepM/ murein hydrolase activator NlpD